MYTRAMRKRPTIVDVAKVAGVSVGTASQALNKKPGVAQATADRVVAAARKLHYVPSLAAQGLRGGKSDLFSLHVIVARSDDIHPSTWDFYFPVIQGFINEFHERNCRVHLEIDNVTDVTDTSILFSYLQSYNIQGCGFVITTKAEYDSLRVIAEQLGLPMVSVYAKISESIPSVSVDNYRASYEATSWLRGLGHTEIAFVAGLRSDYAALDRERGYKHAMRGLRTSIYEGTWDFESGDVELRRMFSSPRVPSAVFCANDHMALGVLAACRDLRIDVPGQLCIVGFDDSIMARVVSPSLTTMRMPLVQMGRQAAASLLAQKGGDDRTVPQHVSLKAELVVRNSVIRVGVGQ